MKTTLKTEPKTPGTRAVEKYRPRMNKLTRAEREELRDYAMKLAYGSAPAPNRRRR